MEDLRRAKPRHAHVSAHLMNYASSQREHISTLHLVPRLPQRFLGWGGPITRQNWTIGRDPDWRSLTTRIGSSSFGSAAL